MVVLAIGPGTVTVVALLLIVLALVYYLVSTILALSTITKGLDEVIASVTEIIEKSAPVNDVVDAINAHLDAGVDLLEGLLVKKAGLVDAVGLVDGLYPGAAAAGLRNFPESTTIEAPRISEVYTKGTLTLARLGREAPIAAANPAGPVLRNVEGGSLAARLLYPDVRQTAPPRAAAIAGDRHRRARAVRAARRHRRAPQAAAGRRDRRRMTRARELKGAHVADPAAFEYERATSVEGAIASLERLGSEARVIAGGHSLLPMMKLRLANPEHLIDINDLTELSYIREQERRDPDRRADPARRPAASPTCSPSTSRCSATPRRVIADPVVRNRGTIGGSLCQADAAEDLSAVCAAVKASVVIRGAGGERVVGHGRASTSARS